MSHKHRPGPMYRMPYGFGPTAGPRQRPDGKPFSWTATPHKLTVATSFLTEATRIDALLPPGFSLAGEPVVTVEFHVLHIVGADAHAVPHRLRACGAAAVGTKGSVGGGDAWGQ